MTNTIDDRRLVGDLYDAAIDPERWTPLLDRVARSVGARGSAIISWDPSGYSPRARRSSTVGGVIV